MAYHGTLTWWYGADLLVDAVACLRRENVDVEAVIVGDGDAVPDLRTQAAESALNGHLQLSGRYLPIEQALATVAQASCGIVPNRATEINRFALSSKLFEYVALGVPVVAARLPTLTAHFSDEDLTFFDPDDGADLARAIRWVCENGAQHAQRPSALASALMPTAGNGAARLFCRAIERSTVLAKPPRSRPPDSPKPRPPSPGPGHRRTLGQWLSAEDRGRRVPGHPLRARAPHELTHGIDRCCQGVDRAPRGPAMPVGSDDLSDPVRAQRPGKPTAPRAPLRPDQRVRVDLQDDALPDERGERLRIPLIVR